MHFARHFRLSEAVGRGVRCDESGLYVGATPLLERKANPGGRSGWRPRPLADLDREVGETYGAPVTFAGKLGGLSSVARALDRDDLAHAQVAALLLRLPDPPEFAKSDGSAPKSHDVSRGLRVSNAVEPSSPATHKAAPRAPDLRLSRGETPNGVDKYNPYHDERGRFAAAADAVVPHDSQGEGTKPIRVADNRSLAPGQGASASRVAYPEGWLACHEKCLADTEGTWPPSDRPGLYRRCMRQCLGPTGDDY